MANTINTANQNRHWDFSEVTNVYFSINHLVSMSQHTNIRIFNGCVVRVENSVKRVTVRHHEAHRMIPNSNQVIPSDGFLNQHQRSIMDSFSCTPFIRQLQSSVILSNKR